MSSVGFSSVFFYTFGIRIIVQIFYRFVNGFPKKVAKFFGVFAIFRNSRNIQRIELKMVCRNDGKIDPLKSKGHGDVVDPVHMTVKASFHAVSVQDVQDLSADEVVEYGRKVEKDQRLFFG